MRSHAVEGSDVKSAWMPARSAASATRREKSPPGMDAAKTGASRMEESTATLELQRGQSQ